MLKSILALAALAGASSASAGAASASASTVDVEQEHTDFLAQKPDLAPNQEKDMEKDVPRATKVAQNFFDCLESGGGRAKCAQFIAKGERGDMDGGKFSVEAVDALPGPKVSEQKTVGDYLDWMKGVVEEFGPDKATYKVVAKGFDADNFSAIYYARFMGYSDYVYNIEICSKDYVVRGLTKIWNDQYAKDNIPSGKSAGSNDQYAKVKDSSTERVMSKQVLQSASTSRFAGELGLIAHDAQPCGPKSQAPCCNPSTIPAQLCPGGIACKSCGGSSSCECPSPPGPSPGPTPHPKPLPGSDTRLTVVNGCTDEPLWIAHIEGRDVGPDAQDVKIAPGRNHTFHTNTPNGAGLSAARFWPKLGCSDGESGSNCRIGSSGGPGEGCVIRKRGQPDDYSHCAPPVDTKFEATFGSTTSQGPTDIQKDVLDMSLVDGFTLPFTLKTEGGSCLRAGKDFTGMDCSKLSLASCPEAELLGGKMLSLQAVDPKNGKMGGCYSPCMKLTDDKWNPKGTAVTADSDTAGPYCCKGKWATPDTCNGSQDKPGEVLQTSYLSAVKEMCPSAYGYAYDDKTSIIACDTTTRYTLTFHCPMVYGPKPNPHNYQRAFLL